MIVLLTVLATTLACALLLPTVILAIEVAASLLPARRTAPGSHRPSIAVLIPAHDESSGIRATLESVLPQLAAGDRCVVVADNCTDDTATIARAAGACVVERFDLERRGKGYALDFGLRSMDASAPGIVVMVDADCEVARGGIDKLARRSAALDRPVQALYLMQVSADASRSARIAEFAWCVKNRARPLGLDRLGLPCQLMGSGMAFPWRILRTVELASGHIVEDMKLGIDLALQGHPPAFCADVLVTSRFPEAESGTRSQRTRWEHGHLGMITSTVPALLGRGIVMRDVHVVAMALDILIPPLAMLSMLVVIVWTAALGAAVFLGSYAALVVATANVLLMAGAVGASWSRYGRNLLPLRTLLFTPWYAICKAPVYFAFLVKRQTEWVRSKRDLK